MRASWVITLVAACKLDPLTENAPAVSVHILPAGSEVPSILEDAELVNQVALADGFDDKALAEAGGVVGRGTGASAGAVVHYWAFGGASRAPAPIYVFVRDGERIEHPPLLETVPGDAGYNAVHNVYEVAVTEAYAGEVITTPRALSDAIEIGLVEEPVPTGTFVNGPVVLPGTRLEVGDGVEPVVPDVAYARGHAVAMFRLGGALGVQPAASLVPASQVSFLRAAMAATHDATRPIFQATIPGEPPGMKANYTPVAVVVRVDLAPGVVPAEITSDAELFTRNENGVITGYTERVTRFEVTAQTVNLQLQFAEGAP